MNSNYKFKIFYNSIDGCKNDSRWILTIETNLLTKQQLDGILKNYFTINSDIISSVKKNVTIPQNIQFFQTYKIHNIFQYYCEDINIGDNAILLFQNYEILNEKSSISQYINHFINGLQKIEKNIFLFKVISSKSLLRKLAGALCFRIEDLNKIDILSFTLDEIITIQNSLKNIDFRKPLDYLSDLDSVLQDNYHYLHSKYDFKKNIVLSNEDAAKIYNIPVSEFKYLLYRDISKFRRFLYYNNLHSQKNKKKIDIYSSLLKVLFYSDNDYIISNYELNSFYNNAYKSFIFDIYIRQINIPNSLHNCKYIDLRGDLYEIIKNLPTVVNVKKLNNLMHIWKKRLNGFIPYIKFKSFISAPYHKYGETYALSQIGENKGFINGKIVTDNEIYQHIFRCIFPNGANITNNDNIKKLKYIADIKYGLSNNVESNAVIKKILSNPKFIQIDKNIYKYYNDTLIDINLYNELYKYIKTHKYVEWNDLFNKFSKILKTKMIITPTMLHSCLQQVYNSNSLNNKRRIIVFTKVAAYVRRHY